MKQSELFTKTSKEAPKEAQAMSHELLVRGGFIDQLSAGIFSFLPLGFRVLKKIENIIREEMIAIDGQEILMPALHPKENWAKTGRWETLDDLYRFKSYYTKIDSALGGTHEEIIVPLMKRFISSYKDLPRYVFQIQNKFRDEKRAKSGILRGREFFMKDLYSFHTDERDLDKYYEIVQITYKKIFERAGVGRKTYLTFASGGTFSRFSHEYQTVSEVGEDTIYICKKCNLAINKEIIHEQKTCISCGKKNFEEKKAIEVGNIFKLKDTYTKPFNLDFVNKEGKKKNVLMGCYGIGLNRLMGAVVEVNHDKDGIIWSEEVAPFEVHLISLGKNTIRESEEIYKELAKNNIDVLWDDREGGGAGEKFKDADLIGIPVRVVVSDKNLKDKKIEIKKRTKAEPVFVSKESLVSQLKKML